LHERQQPVGYSIRDDQHRDHDGTGYHARPDQYLVDDAFRHDDDGRAGNVAEVRRWSTPAGADSGITEPEANGSYWITLINPQTFTYTVKENPLSPAAGTYLATLPVNLKPVTSLTRRNDGDRHCRGPRLCDR
jgi:hypothetical protein